LVFEERSPTHTQQLQRCLGESVSIHYRRLILNERTDGELEKVCFRDRE
jgi:hypothetical protein